MGVKLLLYLWIQYKEIEGLKPSLYKRLTRVKKEVFAQMLDSVSQYKQSRRKHISRGVAAKLSYADKILLLYQLYLQSRPKSIQVMRKSSKGNNAIYG